MVKPVIYVSQILRWADEFHRKARRWPKLHDGRVPGQGRLTWVAVDLALRKGLRGLPGKSSLAQLLDELRGVRNNQRLPKFSIRTIVTWVIAHERRTGQWPTLHTGPIARAPGETWFAVDKALRNGNRGLPGGSSLANLLRDQFGVRNPMGLPPLRKKDILAWADRHKERTGRWPRRTSGLVLDAPGETWLAITTTLQQGHRGWPGGSSLAQFLAKYRGVRNLQRLPRLDLKRIRAALVAHRRRHGKFPSHLSGPIRELPGETWGGVDSALRSGGRGLPGGSSVFKLHRSIGEGTAG
jgi:hypothetical protein